MPLFTKLYDDIVGARRPFVRHSRYRDNPDLLEDAIPEDAELDPEPHFDETFGDSVELQPEVLLAGSWAIRSRSQDRVLRRAWRALIAVGNWTKGPDVPRPFSIEPVFLDIQTAPIRFLDSYFPRTVQRFWLLISLYAVWLVCFSVVLRKSASAADVPNYGSTVKIDCGYTLWSARNGCGLDGNECRPFSDRSLSFRCPSNCIQYRALEPRAVGDEEVIYRPLVVGGAPADEADGTSNGIYRADSYVCGAAIHAGVVTNAEGGCGVLELIGEHTGYPATLRHGIASVRFNSSFPRSFRFIPGATSTCRDLRWPLLAITASFTAILSIFTTSPYVFFFSIFVSVYLHVSLASDPPDLDSYYSLFSACLGSLLPSTFVMYVMYHFLVRRTLHNLHAQVEKTLLWVGGCWLGALNNETFDQWIPISRLTPHDLAQQPGAIPALIFVLVVLILIAFGQAWAIRMEGRLRQHLTLYGVMSAGLLILLPIPHLYLRLHHYIISVLLLPGTAMQTRPSLLYQGLLVGLFINGVSRWGYASILSTAGDLLGDAQLGSLLPTVFDPQISRQDSTTGNITFTLSWPPLPSVWEASHHDYHESTATEPFKYDGVSVLVNDVERFRTYPMSKTDLRNGTSVESEPLKITWIRDMYDSARPEYFRFAYMKGSMAQDYTKAGVWEADGLWTHMPEGPSR